MIGLQVILFYVLFWWFSWWISGRFLSNKKGVLRYSIFSAIAGLPFYIFLFQWGFYQYQCSNTFYFVPEEKVEKPENFLVYWPVNEDAYYEMKEGIIKLSYYETIEFDNIVSPKKNRIVNMSSKLDESIYNEFKISPLVKGTTIDREEVFDNIKYGLLVDEVEMFGFTLSETYIYNFSEKEKTAGFSKIYFNRDMSSILFYLWPFDLGRCSWFEDKKYHLTPEEYLIKETFYK